MLEPENLDETFRQLTDGLNIEDQPDIPYDKLSDQFLISWFAQVKRELRSMGELMFPHTERAKDLGGTYHGLLLELRKRRLM
jgi:hypothetical protein